MIRSTNDTYILGLHALRRAANALRISGHELMPLTELARAIGRRYPLVWTTIRKYLESDAWHAILESEEPKQGAPEHAFTLWMRALLNAKEELSQARHAFEMQLHA